MDGVGRADTRTTAVYTIRQQTNKHAFLVNKTTTTGCTFFLTHMMTLKGKSAAATRASMVLPMSLITPSVTIISTWYFWFSGSRVRSEAATAATCCTTDKA